MDLRFVSSLLAVIDEGSLAAAARREGMTASAVAQRVSALEDQLKIPLLLRAGRVVQPTPACRAILPQMRLLLREAAALKGILQTEVLSGPVRLGAISTSIGDHAARLVKGLRRAAPEVELQLIPGSSASLFAEFEAENLDAALIVKPDFALPKTMRYTPLEQQQIGWLQPPGAEISNLPLILYGREAWGGEICWQTLQKEEKRPRILAEMDALENIAHMVSEGLGRSILPQWHTMDRHAQGARFTPIPGVYREVGMLSRSRDSASPLIKRLEGILQGEQPN